MKKLLALSLVLSIGIFANAQQHLPSNFYYTKLSNGLQVLCIEDNSVDLVTIEIAVHNGAFTEDSEFNGLSHLYEHMFFKANKDIPSQEAYLDRVHELGIEFNGTTDNERVNYFFTMPSKNLDDGLKFMNSAIRYPLFLSEEMKREDPVVDGEFQRAESTPTFTLQQDFDKNMWGNLVTRKNPIGIHQVILSATSDKMHAIQNKYYWPNNSLLTIAGNVDHNQIFQKVNSIFGDWQPAGFDPLQKWPIPEFPPLDGNKYFVSLSPNARVPILVIGWRGPDTRNDINSTYAADVFSEMLQQSASRFQQQLVDSGYALQVQFGYETRKYVGPFQLFVVPNPSRVKECIQKVDEQIKQFDDDNYFTDEMLQTAKNQLAIDQVYQAERTSQLVHTVSFCWATADLDYYATYIDNVKQITKQDVKNVVDKYIKDKPRVEGILLSPGMQQSLQVSKFEDLMN